MLIAQNTKGAAKKMLKIEKLAKLE